MTGQEAGPQTWSLVLPRPGRALGPTLGTFWGAVLAQTSTQLLLCDSAWPQSQPREIDSGTAWLDQQLLCCTNSASLLLCPFWEHLSFKTGSQRASWLPGQARSTNGELCERGWSQGPRNPCAGSVVNTSCSLFFSPHEVFIFWNPLRTVSLTLYFWFYTEDTLQHKFCTAYSMCVFYF